MELKQLNEIKLRNLIMYFKSEHIMKSIDSIWRNRAASFLDSFYKSFQKLPNNLQNRELRDLYNLDACILLASTNEYEALADYLYGVPGFNYSSEEQDITPYENHGFITMQFTELVNNWNLHYINKNLSHRYLKKNGYHEFIKKYYNSNTINILFFKNGYIDFTYNVICIVPSKGNHFIEYFYDDKKDTLEKQYNLFKLNKNYHQSKGEFYYSKNDKFQAFFKPLIEYADMNTVKKLFQDHDSILYCTDDLESIKEMINIMYKI